MKNTILLSFLMHVFIIAGIVLLPTTTYRKPKMISVYQVALVSMPAIGKPSSANAAHSSTLAPKQVVPMNKPEKIINKITPTIKPETQQGSQQEPTSGSGTINIDTKDFPFAYYLHILRYRIQENWDPPFQQSTADKKMNAIVGFRVLRDGKIVDVVLENSSGHFLFDQAAQRAVYLASPLPPLPDDFSDEQLTVHIEFEELW